MLKISNKYGRIDVIVNNAAAFIYRSVLTATKQDWYKSFGVNIIGTSNIIKHTINNKLMPRGGSIVNMSSLSAFIAEPNMATYNTTKAAIVQLTRNTALDLYKKYGIRVNTICPALTETPAFKKAYHHHKELDPMNVASTWEEHKANCVKRYLILDRFAKPREIAFAVLFYASDESSFCTGSYLCVDGGLSAL